MHIVMLCFGDPHNPLILAKVGVSGAQVHENKTKIEENPKNDFKKSLLIRNNAYNSFDLPSKPK